SIGYLSNLYSNIKADYFLNYYELKEFVLYGQKYNFVAGNSDEIVRILQSYKSVLGKDDYCIDFCYTGNQSALSKEVKNAFIKLVYFGSYKLATFDFEGGIVVRILF
ncbi:MAG: hypothetical protein IKT32_05555, partial [Clostridia bacterium]|nr:hypothetical protein [Clostridia bacterium]